MLDLVQYVETTSNHQEALIEAIALLLTDHETPSWAGKVRSQAAHSRIQGSRADQSIDPYNLTYHRGRSKRRSASYEKG